MKKSVVKFTLFLLLTLTVTVFGAFFGCGNSSSENDVYKVEVSAAKTNFELGEEFSTGDMVVTLKYGEKSETLSVEDYLIDFSNFKNYLEGDYVIKVSVPGRGIETEYTVTVRDGKFTKDMEI